MAPAAELEQEARGATPAAAAAFAAAFFTIVGLAVQLSIGSPPKGDRNSLRSIDEHSGALFTSFVAQAISYILVAYALWYLLGAVRLRRPELPRFVPPLIVLAPVLLIVGGLLTQLDVRDIADQFVSGAVQTEKRADALLDDQGILGPALGSGGTLCLALSFVLVSMNAIRVGLVSRFMGILGVIVGGLLVLPIVPGGQPIVQAFWLAALGALFLGRWPGGRGPAWESGEAMEWPAAQRGRAANPEDEPDPVLEAPPEPDAPTPNRRKRKRRGRG